MLKSLNKYYAANAQDAIDQFKDTLVAAGWTLHDDLSGSSPYAYVLRSQGEDGDQLPCYLYLAEGADRIDCLVYADWNNSTHAGTYYFGNPSYCHVDADSDGPFYVWCSATGDSVSFVSYFSSEYDLVWIGLMAPLCDEANGILQSGVAAGSAVVLQLGSGEAAGFIAGKSYQILDGNNRQWVEVGSVNAGSDQVTVTTLSYGFSAGARIGNLPHRWAMLLSDYSYGYSFKMSINGSGNDTANQSMNSVVFAYNSVSPENRSHQKYILWPTILYEASTNGVIGIQKNGATYLRGYVGTTSEHTVSVIDRDGGTSSGSNTSTTLNDTTKSWTVNEFQGKALIITGGTGAGQFRSITANAASELTVDAAWETIPDATSTYTICDEGWLYFYFNASNALSGAIRML